MIRRTSLRAESHDLGVLKEEARRRGVSLAVLLAEVVSEDLVIPTPVMVEVDYWCRKLLNIEALEVLVEDIAAPSTAAIWEL